MLNSIFDQMDFGPLKEFLEEDDITDISYSNGGQVWLKTLSRGIFQVDRPDINNTFMEKLAFQCSNVMGKTFNMAHPFLDAESAELRMNFVHDSIATNGVACLIRKTPAKIRLNKEKLISEQYVTSQIHDFLLKCIQGRCNIIVAGETGSGKTELVKYLASKTAEDEKIISIEDTLELHLDKIFPTRDIVAMKTNNIASYTEALVACMRQNPIWILLAEVRSAEAVMAVRNSISSGHHILSTIHADRAASIPMRMYSLLESSQDIEQFLGSIHRYVQIGIYVKGYFSKRLGRFQREIIEICEFYVDDKTQQAMSNIIYQKHLDGRVVIKNPTSHLIDYLSIGNVDIPEDTFGLGDATEKFDDTNRSSVEEVSQAPLGSSSAGDSDDPFNMNADNGNEVGTENTQPAENVEMPQQAIVQSVVSNEVSQVPQAVQAAQPAPVQPVQAVQPQAVQGAPVQAVQAIPVTPVQSVASAPVQSVAAAPVQTAPVAFATAPQPQVQVQAVPAQPVTVAPVQAAPVAVAPVQVAAVQVPVQPVTGQ